MKKFLIKHLTKYAGLIILLTIFGCGENSERAHLVLADEEIAAPIKEQVADEEVDRKLIKEGRVEFETGNLITTRKTIFEAVTKYDGYVSSDREFKYPGRINNTVVIRIPADNFDQFLNEATIGIEKFDSKEINVKDVTEEFLDVQARLHSKKELELRYIELLKQAISVTEVLEIEKQMGLLRSEIESIEGRLNYLQNRVSFSTLTMTFYESIPYETEFGQKFKEGFKNGWDNLIWFFVVLTNIWPFILIGLALLLGLRWYRRRN